MLTRGRLNEGVTPSAELRSTRLPDNDRIWLAVGAGYKYSNTLRFDVGYVHLFLNDTNLRREGSTLNVVNGTFESDADLLSAEVRWLIH